LHTYRSPKELAFPPFTGGAVGYVGYDAMGLVEDIPEHKKPVTDQDQIRFMFCDEVIAFDHLQQEMSFIKHLHILPGQSEKELRTAYEAACTGIQERISVIWKSLQEDDFDMMNLPPAKPEVNWEQVRSNFDKGGFIRGVEQIKEYIRAGDIFQAVLSQRFETDVTTDAYHIYRILRRINPSPYLYYLDLGDGIEIVGSSPERLVKLTDDEVETNPIAGTRPRGRTAAEDEQLATDLLQDEKERAEHHMLLDLGRNDVGRVAQFGTVHVPKRMEIERFSHVMHICSTVKGRLAPEYDAVDSLFACFPAGTVSGAPKIRAMEILAELEQDCRHAYSGAIGYFSFSGQHDSCIAIRTLFIQDGIARLQAGAGVVADSVPELEWQETRNKASALLAAVQLAEQMFSTPEQRRSTTEQRRSSTEQERSSTEQRRSATSIVR
jgi:anthranilate synthase component I